MEAHNFFNCEYDSKIGKTTVNCGVVIGVVEVFQCIDKPDQEYALCYLEVMGRKIPETETYAKDRDDGLETVVLAIVDFSDKLKKNLDDNLERYLVENNVQSL